MSEPLERYLLEKHGGKHVKAGTECGTECVAERNALFDEVERREEQLAEAWDEVERLRGVVERLQLEKFALAEELVRLRGQKKGMNPAAAVVDPPAVAGRTRGTR